MKKPALIYIKFMLLIALAYLPMWSFVMSIKNDALTLSYPPFYFLGKQLAAGHIPWWHFNIHLGFPLHADPGFPFWSPITWIWALIGGHNLYSYTLLILLYIYIGGIGMIKLSKWFGFTPTTQLILGIAFPLSGFFSAHLQHPHYVFEAAFVPFVILYFLQLIYQPLWRNAIYFAIAVFFLVNAGYPSFTIGAIYFLFILLSGILLFNLLSKNRQQLPAIQYGKMVTMLGISALLIIILCLPFLYSVWQFYPYFNRSSSVTQEYIASGGMTFRSLIALLFPMASASDPGFFGTDRSWSNVYIGLGPLLFYLYALFRVKHSLKYIFIIAGLFMMAASMQGSIKHIFFDILPFFNRMHSNGGLRIYFMLSMLIVAGMGIDKFLNKEDSLPVRKTLLIAMLFLLAISFLTILLPGNYSFQFTQQNMRDLPVKSAMFLQAVTGIIFIIALLLLIKKKTWFTTIMIGEIIVAFLINLPYTGLSMNSTSKVNKHFHSMLQQDNGDARLHFTNKEEKDEFFNDPVLFYENIGVIKRSSYPSSIKQYFTFLESPYPEKINIFKPVFGTMDIYSDSLRPQITNLQMYGDQVELTVQTFRKHDTLVLAQNNYPNWKYQVNSAEKSITPVWGTFTGLVLSEGKYSIKGVYRPTGAIISFAISIFAWIALSIVLLKKKQQH